MGKLRSGRVKKLPQSGITSDRYQFLGLEQAEPDLGDPLVGVSSVGVKPYTGAISDLYVVTSSGSGERYWTKQTAIIQNGITNQGSITVRNKGAVVGNANQITDVNFVGNGVTVISPASWWTGGPGTGYSSVDVQITVTDVAVTGNTGSVPYKASTGFLVGSTDLIYSSSNNYVGIGSTIPTAKLDILGNVNVSGIITTSSAKITTLLIPNNGSVGIGTTNAIASLDVRGTVNIAGIATVATIVGTSASITNFTSGISTIGFLTATNSYVGVLTVGTTLNSLNNSWFSGNIGVGTITPQRRIDVVGSAATDPSQVAIRLLTTNTSTGYGAYIGLNASSIGRNYHIVSTGVSEGIGTGKFSIYDVTANSHRVVIGTAGSVGIGTTNPQYALDINGTVGINSFLYVGGLKGDSGNVLLSGGLDNPVKWGTLSGATAGAASSVTITNTSTNSTYYPTFTEESTTGNTGNIRVKSTGLVFNPGTNTLGIETTNVISGVNTSYNLVARTSNITGFATFAAVQVSGVATFTNQLDLRNIVSVATTITIGSQNQLTSGILTSTTTSAQTVDSFSSSSIRSAKYNIQVTTTGQLVSSASTSPSPSVTSLGGGSNYVSGNYTNVELSTVTGSGADAYADINITPETTLTLNSISADAIFISSELSPTLRLYEPIIFNKAISASAAQNSKVTSISLTNPGSGYTSIPTIGIATPTNNPLIPGVGIGSSATATVSSMVVTDVTINTPGIHTAIVPTIQFNAPLGIGSTALGIVGFGVSSIKVNSPGFGYVYIPNIVLPGAATNLGTAGVSSIFVTNIELQTTGTGYTGSSGGANFPVITIDGPVSGAGTTATATVSSLGISTIFNITTGIGYTVPPILTVSPPTGIGTTATIQSSLGIGTFIITNPGAGYTASPLINLNPTPTDFDYVVGLGITSTGTVITPGVGYNDGTYGPTDCISVGGVGTGAQVTLIINAAKLVEVRIVNSGYGYTVAPAVDFSGIGPGSGATVKLGLKVTDVKIINPGYGITFVPTASVAPKAGQIIFPTTAAALNPSMGIGRVTVNNFGSGYTTNPDITITPPPVGYGIGASVIPGLGVTSSNITITNPGVGYTAIIPKVRISSPVGVGTSATGIIGVGITGITVTSPGYAYTQTLPSVSVISGGLLSGSGLAAGISSIVVTNVFVTSPGAGYTAADLAIRPIATYNPTGTISTVGFGVSIINITYSGIGYTTPASAAITISKPNIGVNTAVASASLGYPGILAGPGYGLTTQVYYIVELNTNAIKLCTGISGGVGIGTITSLDVSEGSVAGGDFSDVSYLAGGSISNVNIVSPGSGYTVTSRLTATNFDGGNVGYGFSFVSGAVVNNYQISDVMVLNNVGAFSTTPDFIEYGTLANSEILGTFSSDLSGSNVRLLFTPTYRNNTIKVNKNYTTT